MYRKRWQRTEKILYYVLLSVFSLFWLFPILWAISTSFKPEMDTIAIPPRLIPKEFTLDNYYEVIFKLRKVNLVRSFFNSLFVASVFTALVLTIDSLAAYAFARLEFKGRDLLFFLVIAALIVPGEITLIPVYLIFHRLGLLNTYYAVIIPGLGGVFGVFLLRQFFLTVPRELEDAARIDGCSKFKIFYKIVLPLAKPAIATLGIMTFLGSWNSFLWPYIVLDSVDMQTLPIALLKFLNRYGIYYGITMAGATLATIPPLIFFWIAQGKIVEGIHMTGLKG